MIYKPKSVLIALLLPIVALLTATPNPAQAASNPRERLLMDSGWRFHLGDPDKGPNSVKEAAALQWWYRSVPRGEQPSEALAAAVLQMDQAWRRATATQDVFGGRSGFAWYRATLGDVPGPRRVLHFEGVDDNATVYLNGTKLIHHEGWDDPFDVPLDSAWKPGGPNVLTVLVENTAGAGSIGETSFGQGETSVDSAFAQTNFNAFDWRSVHLPHDFVVEGAFTPTADAGHGSLPTGIGWYRKTFAILASDKGRALWLDFDGVYRNSLVWLNGKLLGNHKSGYTGFRYDITDKVNYGGENTLTVRADARAQEGWWYEGGGIYRHVWLNKANRLHIVADSVFVTSKVNDNGSADIHAQVGIEESRNHGAQYKVVAEVQTKSGKVIIRVDMPFIISGGEFAHTDSSISLSNPKLWSLETPTLYYLVTRIQQNGREVDTITTPFGIRTIKFDAAKGFFLNGKPIKIQGTCNHQDFAGVGIAMPDSLLDWRVKKLKAMGSNAYRMSHNPPAAELLDACDRQGMLVMDEARHLGDTSRPKTSRGTSTADLSELKEMVLRDRNHPSIIMWSMCNEEPLQGTEDGARIFKAMKDVTLALDPTRPVTCAMNGGWGQGITNVQDLQGINYSPNVYNGFHRDRPDMPVYGSETASAVSTRGEYVNDTVKGYVSAYDVNAPPWAQTAEVAWKALGEREYMVGGYVWTGFDYKGEPTPYGWPCINSHFGIMDECGFPKDTYYYYLSWWGDKPVAHILPHWNWPGEEGKPKDVWVHSNANRVELFLNGTSLGAKDMPRLGHLQWSVPYAPGKLEAKGYDKDGKLIVTDVVETTGKASQIRLKPDRKTVIANGEEVIMVEVELLDDKGRVVPDADNEVTFEVNGAGQAGGVGNGDPSSHEPDKASRRHAFHGLCMLVVQVGEKPGGINVTASAAGLKSVRVTLQAARQH